MPEFNLPTLPEENPPAWKQRQEERKNRLIASSSTMGKLPPQAVEIEEGILGSIIYDSDCFIDIADIIKPFHFYREEHKKIMEAIFSLFSAGEPIDELTLTQKMRSLGTLEIVGGQYYIANLSNNSKKAGNNIEYHARIVMEKFMQREMIRTASEAIQLAYEDTNDIFELIEKNQTEVYNILSGTHTKKGRDITDLIKESMIEMMQPAPDGLTGVGSGFTDLDAITGGWQKSDLVIIAARPAMGKTAFVIECASNASLKFDKPTAVFSLEMSSLQLTNRLIARKTNIKLDKILKRKVNEQEFAEMGEALSKIDPSKLIIDDSPGLNIFEFRAKCRRLKAQYDIQLIVIDYLQLMHSGEKNGNRDAEIGAISRALKSVAKELDVPVLALSQLSRAVEARSSKRPMLSDLRESGNIEQDADMVLFLHRPEYYGITEDARGKSTIGLCETIIAKNRHGVCDTVPLDFNGSIMKFGDWRPNGDKKDLPELPFGGMPKKEVDYSSEQTDEDAPF